MRALSPPGTVRADRCPGRAHVGPGPGGGPPGRGHGRPEESRPGFSPGPDDPDTEERRFGSGYTEGRVHRGPGARHLDVVSRRGIRTEELWRPSGPRARAPADQVTAGPSCSLRALARLGCTRFGSPGIFGYSGG